MNEWIKVHMLQVNKTEHPEVQCYMARVIKLWFTLRSPKQLRNPKYPKETLRSLIKPLRTRIEANLHNYFNLPYGIGVGVGIRCPASRRPIPLPIPAVISQNVTTQSCLVCVKSEKCAQTPGIHKVRRSQTFRLQYWTSLSHVTYV